ncbi:MAG: MscL family protein [Bacillota bacterium]|nr:MscL family protein [Bacillota bacterium]
MTKEEKKKLKKSGKSTWKEFKAFISRGNVLDLAVGVIMASAFSAIVTAFSNILLSICTWGVPGGINGLVTVLPALNSAQAGVDGIGQSFASSDLVEVTITYAANQGATITASDASFTSWQSNLLKLYTLHGSTYTYNNSAIIDWGTFINAIISFLVVAICLFTIVKVFAAIKAKNDKIKADQLEKYYEKHPEERPAPVAPEAPKPTEVELLAQIRDLLKSEKAKEKKE